MFAAAQFSAMLIPPSDVLLSGVALYELKDMRPDPFAFDVLGLFGYERRVDRVSAARERLSGLKRELAASDFFCVDCRYLKGSDCSHPAVQDYYADPVRGRVEAKPVSARDARSENGGCGPEAALFDPPQLIAAKAAWSGLQTGAALVIGAIMALGLLAQFVL